MQDANQEVTKWTLNLRIMRGSHHLEKSTFHFSRRYHPKHACIKKWLAVSLLGTNDYDYVSILINGFDNQPASDDRVSFNHQAIIRPYLAPPHSPRSPSGVGAVPAKEDFGLQCTSASHQIKGRWRWLKEIENQLLDWRRTWGHGP